MKKTQVTLLNLLRAALHEEPATDPELQAEEWQELLTLAEAHKLLPLILDAACGLPSCRRALGAGSRRPSAPASREEAPAAPAAEPPRWKDLALEQVARQVSQENEFLNLILALRERGLEPAVLKGPVCRALYPKPMLRPSVDDDLLIPAARAAEFHAALLDQGLASDKPKADPEADWELSYHKPDSPLYIELHKLLFDPEAGAFRGFNEPFADSLDRAVPLTVQDVTLQTLAPGDHLLFLILHAFKHFLHSGFGLRIVSDICLFTWRYGGEIDFARICGVCAGLRCDRFTAALYRIGEKYLDFPIPEPFAVLETDEAPMLADVLESGLHGAVIDRLHSANITLGAVEDANAGKAPSGGLTKTLFPPAKQLAAHYPWLEKRPWLLPAAWVRRAAAYLRQRRRYGEQSPAASLRIGKERVGLLETYGVIDKTG